MSYPYTFPITISLTRFACGSPPASFTLQQQQNTWSVNNTRVVKGLQRLRTVSHGVTTHVQPRHYQEVWNINKICEYNKD